MIQSRIPGDRIHLSFRVLAVAAALAAFAQITLGGVVRVTGSGLGCPDWPLCQGRIIPPLEFETLIEYSHRLSASALSLFVLATAVMALLYYRSSKWAVRSSILGLVFVIAAAGLGGATVLTELMWWVRLVHLGVAEIVVAAMIVAAVFAWRARRPVVDNNSGVRTSPGLDRLLAASLVGVFIIIISGSYIVGYGAGSSCASWPLCRGSLFPEGAPFAVHMGHRYVAGLIGLLVLYTSYVGWRGRASRPDIAWSAVILAIAFLVQVLVGALTVWAGFSAEMKAVHLSVGTLVWMALVYMAATAYVPMGFEARQAELGVTNISQLEGLRQ